MLNIKAIAKRIAFVSSFMAAIVPLFGCATVRRHPTATKVVLIGAGAGAGLAVGILTRQHKCPTLGGRYDGTPGINGCPTHCDNDGCYTGPGSK